MRTTKSHATALAFAVLFVTSASASASISKEVQKALKGSLVITEQPLAVADGSKKETLRAIKNVTKKKLKHTIDDGVATWQFHFMAFMKRAPSSNLVSLDFYDKKKQYVANKRFSGIDPTVKLLQSPVNISEDDGVKRNASYTVKLTAEVKGKEIVLATTTLRFE